MHKLGTIREAYRQASSFLREHGIESADREAEWMMIHLLQLERTSYFLQLDHPFPSTLASQLEDMLQQRSSGYPIQYILGEHEFYGRVFAVNPSVLIPRPETELLIEAVLQRADKLWQESELKMADIGTGSGAIVTTLALERPQWQCFAIDVSSAALQVAKQNANQLGVGERVNWSEGEWLTPLIQTGVELDIIVSNPPYIPSVEIASLQVEVRSHEPHLALDGGEDGLSPYRILSKQAQSCLKERGMIAFEVGAGQGEEVAALLEEWLEHVEVKVDLAGIERMVIGWRT
ncbi:peptide chain release factor N(5)-glutamine methyltransferase [Mechercharimyces sp. CAU 1602]|uniref:peptide chain release factor N(5)-glutamine methyltransferase n=1 Tax=Mechercharimyces sp. CAU 1602 TaxID=2973933 RepID=UPI002162CC6C|nr:peptide chain release factor N(5)-glutamine methyltransferase [Mechercharimyces sp. CAU 1602]MCS1352314.1 peptide chain release factor N(5)-glutamine methyltransferase [Mechercharimyces sp. CAU 1602]